MLTSCPSPGTVFGGLDLTLALVTQTVTGISVTSASSTAFRFIFTQYWANQTGTFTNNVVISSIIAATTVSTFDGVSITYNITTPMAIASVVSVFQNLRSANTALIQSLNTVGFTGVTATSVTSSSVSAYNPIQRTLQPSTQPSRQPSGMQILPFFFPSFPKYTLLIFTIHSLITHFRCRTTITTANKITECSTIQSSFEQTYRTPNTTLEPGTLLFIFKFSPILPFPVFNIFISMIPFYISNFVVLYDVCVCH